MRREGERDYSYIVAEVNASITRARETNTLGANVNLSTDALDQSDTIADLRGDGKLPVMALNRGAEETVLENWRLMMEVSWDGIAWELVPCYAYSGEHAHRDSQRCRAPGDRGEFRVELRDPAIS